MFKTSFFILFFIFISFDCASDCRSSFNKKFRLLGANGQFYESSTPGKFGGYRRGGTKIYGRLNCPSALRWIARGHYVKYRVFFKTERDALRAGFRPCKICMPERYRKDGQLKAKYRKIKERKN